MFRIMKTNNFDTSIFYKASCACSDNECNLTLDLEIDKEYNMINLSMYNNLKYASYWKNDNWLIERWYRIKGAISLLWTGHIKVENTFLFDSKEQINDFLNALKKGMEELENL